MVILKVLKTNQRRQGNFLSIQVSSVKLSIKFWIVWSMNFCNSVRVQNIVTFSMSVFDEEQGKLFFCYYNLLVHFLRISVGLHRVGKGRKAHV